MDKRNLSDRYSDLRIEKGLSQTELAAALGCNKQYISKFEDGSRSLSLAMLEKYADFFGVSTDYLLGRTDVKTVNADLAAACEYTGLSEKAVKALLSYSKKIKAIPDDTEILDHWYSYEAVDYKQSLFHLNSIIENQLLAKLSVDLSLYSRIYSERAYHNSVAHRFIFLNEADNGNAPFSLLSLIKFHISEIISDYLNSQFKDPTE